MNLRKKFAAGLALAALLAWQSILPAAAQPGAGEIATLAAQAQLQAGTTHSFDERPWLDRFYAPRGYARAWSDEQAGAALQVLRDAAARGLDPADYNADTLARQLADPAADRARLDVELTRAMLHFLADLHFGRVRPEFVAVPPDARPTDYDPVAQLNRAFDGAGFAAVADAAEPRFPLYARIKAALDQYRELARQPYRPLPPLPAGAKLVPGSPYRGAAALRARLVLLGDLPPDAAAATKTYGDELAEAVRRFQARHGLDADGVLGRETLAALNVPLATRARQLELTLERLRWLPEFTAGPVVAVNLPSYRLWAFRLGDADPAPPLEMRVIVGAAVKTPTPLFIGQMRYLEFNPYWNVPRSITLKEMIPKLSRNPGYLAQEQMELVPVGGGSAITRVDAASLAALGAGRYRLRQRPGPKNALGAVKFAMPNPMDIYLHSTPARELFRRTRRDLSHGCIRVEKPVELAQFVLGGQWSAGEVEEAMAPGPTRRVTLPAVVPVVLFYATATVDSAGKAVFARDVYGRDPVLSQALAAHGAQISKAPQPPTE